MRGKPNRNFICFGALLIFLVAPSPTTLGIDSNELVEICKNWESAIVNVSMEYEWYNIPPWTREDMKRMFNTDTDRPVYVGGYRKVKLVAGRFIGDSNEYGAASEQHTGDGNSVGQWRFFRHESAKLMGKDGNTWDITTKMSFNGEIYKQLVIGGFPKSVSTGMVTKEMVNLTPQLMLSPLGFSVFRFAFDNVTGGKPLSDVLKREELVRVDNTIREVNGFRTIRVDLLKEWTKQVCVRVYFSVDHNYTPVRYEYMKGGEKPEDVRVGLSVDVRGLEEVGPGLWFPKSGIISSRAYERASAFVTVSEILVNQNVGVETFDITFPPGTEVWDKIRDLKYVVKPN